MDFQIDSRDQWTQELRVGQREQEVAVFRKVNLWIHNLRATIGGLEYQLKNAAPWNGFRYQLVQGDRVLATAKRHRRMHAFDANRPLIRHNLVEFQLDVSGRALALIPEDRHASSHRLEEAGQTRGRLSMRGFEDQMAGAAWPAILTAPDDWSVPHAAFVAWLAREGRSRMR
jgi:hypothetical protein